jgi:hypothetical protein
MSVVLLTLGQLTVSLLQAMKVFIGHLIIVFKVSKQTKQVQPKVMMERR